MKIANEQESVLLTEDKDFGELTHRLNLEHKGILLIRLTDIPRNERISLITEIVKKHHHELINNFSVLNNNGLRIKKTPKKKK